MPPSVRYDAATTLPPSQRTPPRGPRDAASAPTRVLVPVTKSHISLQGDGLKLKGPSVLIQPEASPFALPVCDVVAYSHPARS